MNNVTSDKATSQQTEDLDRLPMPEGPARPAKPIVLVVIAALVASAIVLTVVLVGKPKQFSLVFPWQSGSHPAVRPTPRTVRGPAAAPPVRFDPRTRTFLADGLAGTLPAAWFMRRNGFIDIGNGVGGCFGNGCPKLIGQHPLEDNIPWGAEFEIVEVEDGLTGKDLNRTADNILAYWRQYTIFYTDVSAPVIARNESKRTLTTNLPRPARMITAELRYHKPGLKITYDHFYLLVVGGTSGRYTAFVAAWSDNATSEATTAIQNSINTLRVV